MEQAGPQASLAPPDTCLERLFFLCDVRIRPAVVSGKGPGPTVLPSPEATPEG